MSVLNVYERSLTSWEEVLNKVNKAVVFIDDAIAEVLHWNGGAGSLMKYGAEDIKEFSSFESGKQKKAVFLFSGLIKEKEEQILEDIIKASHFQYVIVITTLNPNMQILAHHRDVKDELELFSELQDKLLVWMGSIDFSAEVLHMDLEVATLTKNFFILPAQQGFFPLLPHQLENISHRNKDPKKRGISDMEYCDLPRELQLKFKLMVCSLNSMLEQLGVADDVYSLGPSSHMVASELSGLTWAKTRRKASQTKASLLLVDRTLDLPSAVGHHSETLAEKIYSVLPRLTGQNNDVAIDMTNVCSMTGTTVVFPGCLAQPMTSPANSLLNTIFSHKQKESLMEVNRQIVESASREGLPLSLTGKPGRVTVDQLQSHLDLFRGKIKHIRKASGIIQLTQATITALKSDLIQRYDGLYGVEKGLLQAIGEGEAEGVSVLKELTNTMSRELDKPVLERNYSLEDILQLLVYVYSFSVQPDNSQGQQQILKSCIKRCIMETNTESLPQFIANQLDNSKTEDAAIEIVESIFDILEELHRAHEGLHMFGDVHNAGDFTSQASLKPLLKQLGEKIFDPAKPDLADVQHKSTGFGNLLKSGFGLFRNVSKPRPGDHPLLIVFVLGGVTPTEVRQITETASSSGVQVLVGGTCIANHRDILEHILNADYST